LNQIATSNGYAPEQDETLLQFHSEENLAAGVMIYGRDKIRAALAYLETRGVVKIHKNPDVRFRFDRTKHFEFFPEVCNAWIAQNYEVGNGLPIAEKSAIEGRKNNDGGRFSADGGRKIGKQYNNTLPNNTPSTQNTFVEDGITGEKFTQAFLDWWQEMPCKKGSKVKAFMHWQKFAVEHKPNHLAAAMEYARRQQARKRRAKPGEELHFKYPEGVISGRVYLEVLEDSEPAADIHHAGPAIETDRSKLEYTHCRLLSIEGTPPKPPAVLLRPMRTIYFNAATGEWERVEDQPCAKTSCGNITDQEHGHPTAGGFYCYECAELAGIEKPQLVESWVGGI
jgi:hypothetical protein